MPFEIIFTVAAMVAGAVATVGGFGIGSLLTPLLALTANTKLAVAAVAIPHLVGAAFRLWRLRAHIDRRVLWSFGMMSAWPEPSCTRGLRLPCCESSLACC